MLSSYPSNAMSPATSAPRNGLALISLLMSLIFPLAVVIITLSAFIVQNKGFGPPGLFQAGIMIEGLVASLGLPGMIAALVTGHIALACAQRYPVGQRRRGLAIAGLVIGYASMAIFLGVIGLFLSAVSHGF